MIDAHGVVDRLRADSNSRRAFLELPEGALSYSGLWKKISQTVALFESLALPRGGRILIVTQGDQDAIVLFIAALLDGRCPALLPADTPQARAGAIADKMRPDCVFVDDVIALAAPWTQAWKTIAIAASRPRGGGILGRLLGDRAQVSTTYPAMLDALKPREPVPTGNMQDLAFVSFTSGTTAAPKGVMITHRNLFEHLATIATRFDYGRESRILNNMVLSHVDGLVQGPLLALACGGTLLRPRPLDARSIGPLLEDVYALHATHFITVPTILSIAARRAEHDDYFRADEFRHLVSVAAKLDPTIWSLAERRFGVRISNMYGLTETVTGGLFCGPDDASHAIGTVGVPVDIEARIVDAQGDTVAAGEVGELWLRGANVTPGYLDDATATAELFSGDWLRTGDLAVLRPDGKYEICGRLKALVVSGGFSVHPDEIDEVLLAHPSVGDAASIGIPHPEWGEVLVSAVVASKHIGEESLIRHCRDHLEPKKVPMRIHLVDALPRGRSGKVDRAALARLVLGGPGQDESKPDRASAAAEVFALASRVFRVPHARLSERDDPDSIDGWDSLNHLQLINAVEDAFDIEFAMADVMGIRSLGALVAATERKRGSR
jgi:long-chain acyl-CoA synthetase